jgi:hypothetical protein
VPITAFILFVTVKLKYMFIAVCSVAKEESEQNLKKFTSLSLNIFFLFLLSLVTFQLS